MEEVAELTGSIEVKLLPKKQYIGKNDGWGFQFLNEEYQPMNPPVCCKDFLQDVIYTELTGESLNIYNFKHKYQGFLKGKELLRLALYWTNDELTVDKFIEPTKNFLNDIEEKLGILKSNVYTDSTNKIIIIDFSSEWIKKPYLFSFFTILCRKGLYYNGNLEEYLFSNKQLNYLESNDSYGLNSYKDVINKILNRELELIQPNWEEFKDYKHPYDWQLNTRVHESGIFSLLRLIKDKKLQEL